MMAETICRIKKTGLMGIVRVDTIERGIEIAQGCIDGGVDVLEISYTNNNAGEVIRALKEKFADQLLVGAGTVLDPTTARLAIMDGAEFIIAPTFNKEVQEMANLYQIPYAPGCTSYTEMIEALKAGGVKTVISGGCGWSEGSLPRFPLWREVMEEIGEEGWNEA